MADVAKRLCGPVLLTATGATYYTVPAATTTIVRSIHVTAVAGVPTVTVGINGVTNALSLYYTFPVPTGGTLDWSGFLVLNAGDTLQASSGAANTATMTVSGVETT